LLELHFVAGVVYPRLFRDHANLVDMQQVMRVVIKACCCLKKIEMNKQHADLYINSGLDINRHAPLSLKKLFVCPSPTHATKKTGKLVKLQLHGRTEAHFWKAKEVMRLLLLLSILEEGSLNARAAKKDAPDKETYIFEGHVERGEERNRNLILCAVGRGIKQGFHGMYIKRGE
jgi:hypothetical protein